MKLPIDTSGLTFLVVGSPRPVKDFETGLAKGDRDGVPLFAVRLVVLGGEEAEVISVKVAGEPKGLVANAPVKVSELTAQPWSINEKSGVSFRATAIVPLSGGGRGSQAA
jgi:hypothetical protein